MTWKMNASWTLGPATRTPSRGSSRQGLPLPVPLRHVAERLFGTDLSQVRIIVSPVARRLGARAFTTGANIYVDPAQYSPDSEQWVRLLGHELAHVVQQREGRARNALGYGVAVVRDPALEAEADRMGQVLLRALREPTPEVMQCMVRSEQVEDVGDVELCFANGTLYIEGLSELMSRVARFPRLPLLRVALTSTSEDSATVWALIRPWDLYLWAFENQHGTWKFNLPGNPVAAGTTLTNITGQHDNLGTGSVTLDAGRVVSALEALANFNGPAESTAIKRDLACLVVALSEASRFHSVRESVARALDGQGAYALSEDLDLYKNWSTATNAGDANVAVKLLQPYAAPPGMAAPPLQRMESSSSRDIRGTREAFYRALFNPPVPRVQFPELLLPPPRYPRRGEAALGDTPAQKPDLMICHLPSGRRVHHGGLPIHTARAETLLEFCPNLLDIIVAIRQSNGLVGFPVLVQKRSVSDSSPGAPRSWYQNTLGLLPDFKPIPPARPATLAEGRAVAYRERCIAELEKGFGVAGNQLEKGPEPRCTGYLEYSIGGDFLDEARLIYDFANDRFFLVVNHYNPVRRTERGGYAETSRYDFLEVPGDYISPFVLLDVSAFNHL
jgi:hypothetical protein